MSKLKKDLFVCFIGIDGSGKTTLAKELVVLLRDKGIESKYVYGRLKPFIMIIFITLGRLFFLNKKFKSYSEYSDAKKKVIKKKTSLSKIYQCLVLIESIIQIVIKVKIPLFLGKKVICDRYIYDTIITDLSCDMDYSTDRAINILNNLLRFLPKPDIAFLIDVSEEIAFQRKNDTPTISYLEERREMYLDIGKKYGMIILDGNKDLAELKEQVHKEVVEYITRGIIE